MRKMTIEIYAGAGNSGTVTDLLAGRSGLSKIRVKDAMNKGAVWLRSRKGKLRHLRRASHLLGDGDNVKFYYDENLLSLKPPMAKCLFDFRYYSVWNKPAGMISQGTNYGDHCSLLRQAGLSFNPGRETFPVHRLDREASGLMLIAHSRNSASKLSALFRRQLIDKEYKVEVLGNLEEADHSGRIELQIDGKSALTEFKVKSYDRENNISVVIAMIKTGRYHQIRRHFNMIGHPVMVILNMAKATRTVKE
jgi:tRNA pseudouridine32 synthase/23S rRNA pseudouridine746 synthase